MSDPFNRFMREIMEEVIRATTLQQREYKPYVDEIDSYDERNHYQGHRR